MILWVLGVYIVLGIMVNIFSIVKEPHLLYAGWILIPYFILGVIVFPYVIWVILTNDDTGGWV